MDARSAEISVARTRPASHPAGVLVLFVAALIGWIVWLAWPLPAAAREVLLPWELSLVLFGVWLRGWRFGLGVALAAELARCSRLHPFVGYAAAFWIVELAAIWWMTRLRAEFLASQQRALRDPLTGLPNRRALDEFLEAELSRARRFARPFAVAVLDCDGFKLLNDDAGHAAGDEALQRIGQLLRQELRSYDGVFRLGGDEFVMVLPETDQFGAEHVCERLRTAFAHEVERSIPGLTASLGVAIFPTAPASIAECLAHADETMYRAKRLGPGETAFAVFHALSATENSLSVVGSDASSTTDP